MRATHVCGTSWEGLLADVVALAESHKMRCPAEQEHVERDMEPLHGR